MINKVLDKPESYRRKVAYFSTLVVGVFVFSAWLIIANFNIKQALNPYDQKSEETRLAQSFQDNLPSLRQSESVTTELTKNQETATESVTVEEEEDTKEGKPFWKFW